MNHPMKILVFRLGAMGDILFTTPVLRGLQAEYPGCRITYLTLKKWRWLLKGNPHVARVIGLPYCDPKALGALQTESFDLLVNLFETEQGARVCAAIPARERRGNRWADGALLPDEKTGRLLSRKKEDRLRQHQDQLSCAELFAQIAGVQPDSWRYEYHPGKPAAWRARWFLRRHALAGDTAPIALHLHSRGSTSRNWRAEDALTVVRALPGRRFLVLGHRRDRAQTRLFETEPNAVVSYHPMPVQAAMLRFCALFVGIDSGPRHMASAMQTPIIGLFGPTPPNLAPPLDGETFLQSNAPCAPCCEETCALGENCIGRISTTHIVEAIQKQLR